MVFAKEKETEKRSWRDWQRKMQGQKSMRMQMEMKSRVFVSLTSICKVRRALGVCDHGRYLRYGGALFHGLGGTGLGKDAFPGAFGDSAPVGSRVFR